MGVQSAAYQKGCVAEGNMSEAGDPNGASDTMIASHAEGHQTKAIAFASHTEGQNSVANGIAAHAEGTSTIAGANYTHVEGSGAQAYKQASHAEGGSTIAGAVPEGVNDAIPYPDVVIPDDGTNDGDGTGGGVIEEKDWGAHAEGLNTRALAMAAHAEGEMTKADRYAAHAEGIGTIAHTLAQHVEGKYNIEDIEHDYVHIVGNGESNTKRSNAHTLDWQGNAWFAGNVTVGNDNDKLVKTSEINNKEDIFNKTNLLSDASTNEQYPSAKATVDYVKQKISGIYTFLGSNALDQLPEANTIGKGAVFNMLDSGKRVFSSNAFGKISSINIEECPKIVFEFPLPDTVLRIEIIDEESMQIYTVSNLQYSNFIDGKYVYSDIDGVLYNTNTEHSHYCMTCEYTLSVNKGDNIISTGYYWDNFGSYIDLSNYATKADLTQLENNIKAYINEIILGGEW